MPAFLHPQLPVRRRRRQLPHSHPPTCTARPQLSDLLRHGMRELQVGSVVVPRHLWDPRMRQKGVYRSVEYTVEQLMLDDAPLRTTRHIPSSRLPDVVATLRPRSRLLPRFEREWPVCVSVHDARLFSYKADLFSCAAVTLALSAAFLTVGAVGPRFISIYSIPSASMYPTLRIGDALLVEKLSLRTRPPADGEIVLFRPPRRLLRMMGVSPRDGDAVAWRHARIGRNDLFVKRVVAIAGDIIEVRGRQVIVNDVAVDSAAPGSPDVEPQRIPEGFVFVVGDNAERSLDSRFWGLLPVDYVVGRPVARIFPLDRLEIGV